MIAIDTNVLVRFLINDDPHQSPKAKRLIEDVQANGEQAFIAKTVLVETVWVLERVYGFSKKELEEVIDDILSFDAFLMENSGEAADALDRFKTGKADFSDYLTAVCCLNKKASAFYTFDKRCREKDLFRQLH